MGTVINMGFNRLFKQAYGGTTYISPEAFRLQEKMKELKDNPLWKKLEGITNVEEQSELSKESRRKP